MGEDGRGRERESVSQWERTKEGKGWVVLAWESETRDSTVHGGHFMLEVLLERV